MSYNETKTRTWDRATPNDGLLIDLEIDRIYADFAAIVNNGGSAPPRDLALIATDLTNLENIIKTNSAVKTADYTILDSDNLRLILVNSISKDVTIILPTLADNQERELIIKATHAGGKIIIDGEGGETIDGALTFVLQSQYDFVKVKAIATEWVVLNFKAVYSSGWINTNDWLNRHLGSATIAYNNLSGTFIVGELITEEISGNTGIIQSDAGSILILKNVTGTGIFTNSRELTGSTSSATADINGDTKNIDSNVLHLFNKNIDKLKTKFFWNTTATDATASCNLNGDTANNGFYAKKNWGVDADNIKIQTGDSGIMNVGDAGGFEIWNTEDYYYKIIIEVIR